MKIKRIGIFAVLLAFSVSLCACGEALVKANADTVEALAEALIQKNSLTGDELKKFFKGREKKSE